MIQLFWHFALVNKDEGFRSVASGGEKMRSPFFPSSNLSITFAFKVEDKMSLMHRFTFYVQSLTYLMTAIIQRMGGDIDCNNLPQKLVFF